MAAKTIVFLVGFVICCFGGLFMPILGVFGYALHYQIMPETQWWGQSIAGWGIRYSFLLAAFTMVGMFLNHQRLQYGPKLLSRHEWLLLLFLGAMWLSTAIGMNIERTQPLPEGVDVPVVKMTKALLFVLLLTHVVTTHKGLNAFFWAIVLGALYLGHQAYAAGSGAFIGGRLNDIGGPDFRDSNQFGAFLLGALPIIAITFMRSGWPGRLVCLASGVLATNAIIMTRSRGTVIALGGAAVVAVLLSPKRHRKAIVIGLVIFAVGSFALTDPGFWKRAETINAPEAERDPAAQSRIEVWKASLAMFREHPFGVGIGNFQRAIMPYYKYEKEKERDAHNSYVRCYSELGIHGALLYGAIIVSALVMLRKLHKRCGDLPGPEAGDLRWMTFGVLVSLTTFLLTGLTMTGLYLEGPWWFLALPVCLSRAAANLQILPDGVPEPEVSFSARKRLEALRAKAQVPSAS